MLAAFAGNDDCPGRTIPGETIPPPRLILTPAIQPVLTIRLRAICSYYCYYTTAAVGPDHVYSFTLTGRGANPQIQVSATSGTYNPLIYVC